MSIRKSELLQAKRAAFAGLGGHLPTSTSRPGWRSDRSEAELPQGRVREGADELFEVGPALT